MPWAANDNVTAILSAHYPGEEIGNVVVDVLWGKQEPSGRLPYTIPRLESDYGPPIVDMTGQTTEPSTNFTEGQLIDYKHFDAHNIEPLYEFGFGLSYTEFELSQNLDVKFKPDLQKSPDQSLGKVPGGWKDLWNEVATVSVEIENVGKHAGSVIPQLDLPFPQDQTPSGTPVRVLRGFAKSFLQPRSVENMTFSLNRRDVSFWDIDVQEWMIPDGSFTFSVGFSSRNLRVELGSCVL